MALRPRQRAFLAAYAELGNITEAAKAAQTGRRSHYDWLDEDEYKAEFDDATERYCDLLRSELRERVLRGLPEPVIYQGQLQFEPLRDKHGNLVRDRDGNLKLSNVPLVIYKKTDISLLFEMKKHMPEYRDNAKVEHTGAGGAPLSIEVKFVQPQPAA